MNFYKRHLGDYAKDTGHLTMLEHGAYTLLLDRYYGTEGPIPAAEAYRVCRARSKDEKAAVDAVLAEFFTLSDAQAWTSKRADSEIEKASKQRDTNREIGKRGGRPKKTDSVSESQTESVQEKNPSQTPDSTIGIRDTSVNSAAAPETARGKPLTTKDLVAEGIPEDIARDWLAVRKAKKAALTPTAWDAVKREAGIAGISPSEAVRCAAENGWQGFKSSWLSKAEGDSPKKANDHFAGAL